MEGETTTPETPVLTSLGIVCSRDEIPFQSAYAAHAGTSWTPDVRARQEQAGFVAEVERFAAQVLRLWEENPKRQTKEWLCDQILVYRDGYRDRLIAKLAAQSRVLSSAVTGPSNFPTRRNEKRLSTEKKRLDELVVWSRSQRAWVCSKISPVRIIYRDDPEAVEKLREKREKLASLLETMKAANALIRKKLPDREGKIEALVALGFPKSAAEDLMTPDFAGRLGFASYNLSNGRAELKRLDDRIAVLQAEQKREHVEVYSEALGALVIDSPEQNRIMLKFDERPEAAMYRKLRQNGFVWSHRNQAWQRQRTENSRATVLHAFGVDLDAPRAGEETVR